MPDATFETRAAKTGKSYDPVHFARLASVEERHFWFVARRRLIEALAARIARPGSRVLEIGCGTGNVLAGLELACPASTVIGMDLFGEGLAFAHARGRRRLVQADAHRPPFRGDFDVVGAFDVIEHLPDDASALADMHRLLRPGGMALITVPASKRLWSEFDEVSHHYRRYEKEELESKLAAAGFEGVFVSPFMTTTAPLVWIHRKRKSANRPAEETGGPNLLERETRIIPGVNEILRSVLSLESRLILHGMRLPFGSSLIAKAVKR